MALLFGPSSAFHRSVKKLIYLYEPAHDKTYDKTCVTRKDSDQPVHPLSMAVVLIHPSLDNPDAVEGSCDQ